MSLCMRPCVSGLSFLPIRQRVELLQHLLAHPPRLPRLDRIPATLKAAFVEFLVLQRRWIRCSQSMQRLSSLRSLLSPRVSSDLILACVVRRWLLCDIDGLDILGELLHRRGAVFLHGEYER